MSAFARIAAVTGFVALLGGVVGAVGGALIILAFGLANGEFFLGPDGWFVYGVASTIGAVYGVVLGTILSWTLLRRAPLWRAIGEPAIAASVTATLSFMSFPGMAVWLFPAAAAVLAALRLRYAIRRQPAITGGSADTDGGVH